MNIKYSVVIPVYNEEDSVKPLEGSLKEALDSLEGPYEIIFVNDGSTDKTLSRLKDLEKVNPRLSIITLEKNSGQTASLRAGFQMAKGDVIISMDGDLQTDVGDIPILLDKLDKGFDVVCGWRRKRKDTLWKKVSSRIANVIQGMVFKSKLHDISCTLRAYKKSALKGVNLGWDGAHRFLPYLLIKDGKKIAEVEVRHYPRKYGKSKYKPTKMFKTSADFLKLLITKKI